MAIDLKSFSERFNLLLLHHCLIKKKKRKSISCISWEINFKAKANALNILFTRIITDFYWNENKHNNDNK